MKVRIGGLEHRFTAGAGASQLQAIENQISGGIIQKVVEEAQEITPKFLRRLRTRLQAAATGEANAIFQTITGIIDTPRGSTADLGIRYMDLMRGAPSGATGPGGRVSWEDLDLSPSYAMRKRKARPANRSRFFRYNNHLRNYLARQGPSIVRSRLGGIQVDVDETPVSSRSSSQRLYAGKVFWRSVVNPEDIKSILLGRVTVTMFPRLTPSLAPMLSTRRWTDSGKGAMERQMFAGTKAAQKLVNKGNPFRPLVTPTVQFFMLVRIPAAIRNSLNNYLTRTGIRLD